MVRLRQKLNAEEVQGAIGKPTIYKTKQNRHRLHCSGCGEVYYVHDETLRKATSPLEGDPAEVAFYCDGCEQEYAEEE